jgi:hypothetical protein
MDNSSANLLKFKTLKSLVVSCRDIEELLIFENGDLSLERGDIEAIASLPRLRSLNIYCYISSDTVAALSRCRGLKHLTIRSRGSILSSFRPDFFSHRLYDILPFLGRNLVSLEYTPSIMLFLESDSIVKHCPNLQMLSIVWEDREEELKRCLWGGKGRIEEVGEIEMN